MLLHIGYTGFLQTVQSCSHANGKGHSKKVQLKSKTFWTVKLNLKTKIKKITVRFMTRMAIMIEIPSSRIEKVQTTIPTDYYNEKKRCLLK